MLKKDIETVIEQKDNKIHKARIARLNFSSRLSKYSRKWTFISFSMNVEAIIIVLLSLSRTIEIIHIGPFNISFNLLSGIFTLYVILLQYYINSLNYNERSLQLHYHQLELEDIKNKLQVLYLKKDRTGDNINEEEIINNYDKLIDQYQIAMKNNENHSDIDFKKIYGKKIKDFSLDNILIYTNSVLVVSLLIVIIYLTVF